MLQIMKADKSLDFRRAAYQSCKDIRDFRDRNMTSVTVAVHLSDSLQVVHNKRSKSMCPRAAYGVAKLTLDMQRIWASRRPDYSYSFTYLQQLISNAFLSPDTHSLNRKVQLRHVCSIELLFPTYAARVEIDHLVISQLFSHFTIMQLLKTNVSWLLPCISSTKLQQVVLGPTPPHELQLSVNKLRTIQKLEFVIPRGYTFEYFQPTLLDLEGLQSLSIESEDRTRLQACTLASFTHLSALSLHNMNVSDIHLLTQLHVTHLTLKSIHAQGSNYIQLQPAQWPALRSVHWEGYTPAITESCARAILPRPHPGFSVTWGMYTRFNADLPHGCRSNEIFVSFDFDWATHQARFTSLG